MRDLTIHETAQLVGLSPQAVRDAAARGLINCWRTPGGHRRFSTDDVLRFREAARKNSEQERERVAP